MIGSPKLNVVDPFLPLDAFHPINRATIAAVTVSYCQGGRRRTVQ